jgi:hypothetical protein
LITCENGNTQLDAEESKRTLIAYVLSDNPVAVTGDTFELTQVTPLSNE